MGFKGDIARSTGWVERVRRLPDDAGIDCVELGYLAHASAKCRIFEGGDFAGAHDLFVQAAAIGTTYRDRELITLARIGEGRMLVYLGAVAQGMALLDEARISIEAREISPMAVGDAYCTVIDACAELFDVSRCRAWTESFSRWCDEHADLVRPHLHQARRVVPRRRNRVRLPTTTSPRAPAATRRRWPQPGGETPSIAPWSRVWRTVVVTSPRLRSSTARNPSRVLRSPLVSASG